MVQSWHWHTQTLTQTSLLTDKDLYQKITVFLKGYSVLCAPTLGIRSNETVLLGLWKGFHFFSTHVSLENITSVIDRSAEKVSDYKNTNFTGLMTERYCKPTMRPWHRRVSTGTYSNVLCEEKMPNVISSTFELLTQQQPKPGAHSLMQFLAF